MSYTFEIFQCFVCDEVLLLRLLWLLLLLLLLLSQVLLLLSQVLLLTF